MPTSWSTSTPTGARPAAPSPPSSRSWPTSTPLRAAWPSPRSTSTTSTPSRVGTTSPPCRLLSSFAMGSPRASRLRASRPGLRSASPATGWWRG
ncbi:hypothetical protein CMUS01_16081 [Colletotrichum musicola]|uniref:Uncharacterized protein n=1 Tax=Colletotrichum musicola TaxID=2175873 RepID=A0A8H6IRL4_9PEZI|nr:hypothetical protein CMUS01_16081 [Colletotrichum musicola]